MGGKKLKRWGEGGRPRRRRVRPASRNFRVRAPCEQAARVGRRATGGGTPSPPPDDPRAAPPRPRPFCEPDNPSNIRFADLQLTPHSGERASPSLRPLNHSPAASELACARKVVVSVNGGFASPVTQASIFGSAHLPSPHPLSGDKCGRKIKRMNLI